MGEKLLQNASSCAGRTVRANKLKHQSLEHRKIYCRDKQGEWVACAQKTQTAQWFSGRSFYRQNLGWVLCDFLLIGWWWGNRKVFQKSCAQPEVTILHLGGGLSSYRRTQRYCYIYSLRRHQDPAPRLHYCFLTAPPLFLHSLPSLISNCLNLPFVTQWRSGRLNEAYFLQTRNRGHRKALYLGWPHRVLLCFISCFKKVKLFFFFKLLSFLLIS